MTNPPSSMLEPDSLTGNANSTAEELLPPPVELFLNLTIAPSSPAPISDLQPLSSGIEAIYELLIAEQSSLEANVQESEDLRSCLARYRGSYFKSFHLRWPFLHGPTFDLATASLPLAASVCVIGAWLQSSEDLDERFYALRVHELLLQRLLYNLVSLLFPSLISKILSTYFSVDRPRIKLQTTSMANRALPGCPPNPDLLTPPHR